jgi:hypothetical protein
VGNHVVELAVDGLQPFLDGAFGFVGTYCSACRSSRLITRASSRSSMVGLGGSGVIASPAPGG